MPLHHIMESILQSSFSIYSIMQALLCSLSSIKSVKKVSEDWFDGIYFGVVALPQLQGDGLSVTLTVVLL